MQIIKPTIKFVDQINGNQIIKKLDTIARVCYQSIPKEGVPIGTVVKNCIKSGHESAIEHVSLTFDIITDIGVLAELTRHRLAAYSVESTRYCKYDNIQVIEPIEFHGDINSFEYYTWKKSCEQMERAYKDMMLKSGYDNRRAEVARSVLNKSTKCEIVFTMNLRELRTMLKLRCEKPAHPHIKQIMIPLLLVLKERIPIIFDDIEYDEDFLDNVLSYYYYEAHDTIYTYEKNNNKPVKLLDEEED